MQTLEIQPICTFFLVEIFLAAALSSCTDHVEVASQSLLLLLLLVPLCVAVTWRYLILAGLKLAKSTPQSACMQFMEMHGAQ